MAYIGRGTDKLSNIEKLDTITFDGSSSYTLQKNSVNFTPNSANSLQVSIDGVVQAGNFTVSGSTIDFGVAIPATSTCDFIFHYGTGLITTPADGTVTTAKLADSSITFAKTDGNFGLTRQFVSTQDSAVATGTTTFPEDDTIPQNTEGDEYMTLSITPKSATSKLLITAQVFGSVSTGTRWGIGLFKDSDADALSFASAFVKDATSMSTCYIEHSLTSGSTSAQTFKIRAGSIQTAATFTFNGQSGARRFGGTILSSIHINEIG